MRRGFEARMVRRELDLIDQRLVPVGQRIFGEGRTLGIELLLRWRDDDGRLLPPASLLPRVRAAGLMHEVNEAMLTHAVRFAAACASATEQPFVSVNVSAAHLAAPGLASRLADQLAEHGVRPGQVMVEITESEYVALDAAWDQAVRELRSLGIKLAIDDFGSGYSSIERLQHVPVSHIKFDRLLVKSAAGPFGRIVEGVVRFGAAAGIEMIAEGIETIEDLESMQSIGVGAFQGYLFERPTSLGTILNDLHKDALVDTGQHPVIAPLPPQPFSAGPPSPATPIS